MEHTWYRWYSRQHYETQIEISPDQIQRTQTNTVDSEATAEYSRIFNSSATTNIIQNAVARSKLWAQCVGGHRNKELCYDISSLEAGWSNIRSHAWRTTIHGSPGAWLGGVRNPPTHPFFFWIPW
jgi:hypothetical protein